MKCLALLVGLVQRGWWDEMTKAPPIPLCIGDPQYGTFRCRRCKGVFTPEEWDETPRRFWTLRWQFDRLRHRRCEWGYG